MTILDLLFRRLLMTVLYPRLDLPVDEDGQIMGIKHNSFNVRGVQYHPESIMTEHGKKMISNWLAITDLDEKHTQ